MKKPDPDLFIAVVVVVGMILIFWLMTMI